MPELDQVIDGIRRCLEEKNAAREVALTLSRDIIRLSANAIRAIHREEWERALELMAEGQQSVLRMTEVLEGHGDIYYAGFVQDSHKEYAEARLTFALVVGQEIPGPAELGVDVAPYLNGLAEAIGELRRHLLDYLRSGQVERCEPLLARMDDIFTFLTTIDYPDAMTGGLRRSTDIARGILEKTRGDLTMAIRQSALEATLHDFERRMASG